MIRTRVGYSGGTTPDPTYYTIGDHSESIEIDFDPTIVSYAELVDVFWESHNPANPSSCAQYASGIFYRDDDQRLIAEAAYAEMEAYHGTIYTTVSEAGPFYLAEEYHQKFTLKNVGLLMNDFDAIYPDQADLTHSTAAARVMGVIRYYFDSARLEAELPSFGLSATANDLLRNFAAIERQAHALLEEAFAF